MLINREARRQADWWLDLGPVATLRSKWSNIRLNVYTDQSAVQLYTCNDMDGRLALKSTQGLQNNETRPRVVERHGCVGLEFQDWIDGINNPEWGRQAKQQFGPGDPPYVLQVAYEVYAPSSTTTCATPTGKAMSTRTHTRTTVLTSATSRA